MVVVFRAPRSYTGEDMAELHTHGSPAVVAAVCAALAALGARPAGPGELSRRAFLHGKLDLVQAEAIADLVSARSERARAAALQALDGRLSAALEALREPLVDALAELEARLDFAEEDDIGALPVEAMAARLGATAAELDALAGRALGARMRLQGARVLLWGAPNAGKSTLLNALCGHDRALVHPVAGTTRDLVEVRVEWAGFEVWLVDTAGVRAAAEDVEAAGIALGQRALAAADVVLWLWDAVAGGPPPPETAPPLDELADKPALLRLWSRADRADSGAVPAEVDLGVSALDMTSVAAVRAAVEAALRERGEVDGDGVVVLRARQADALRRAAADCRRGADALLVGTPLEFVAADLRDAALALDEIVGVVGADDVLDVIFARFCVGK
jgi:tRNA modification GTPase